MWSVEACFNEAIGHLDREEKRLQTLRNSSESKAVVFDHDGSAAINRALTYVVCGGILERLMREFPDALMADLLRCNIQRRDLPLPLFGVLESKNFRSCAVDSPRTLVTRARLLKSAFSHPHDQRALVDFSDDLTLADGTTIGVSQFEAIWMVLDLPGDWQNDPQDVLLLKEISSKRNDVAHWKEDPVTVGRSRNYTDLQNLVRRLVRLVEHLYLHVCEWLDGFADSVGTDDG